MAAAIANTANMKLRTELSLSTGKGGIDADQCPGRCLAEREVADTIADNVTSRHDVASRPTGQALLDGKADFPAGTVEIGAPDISQRDAVTATPGSAALRFVKTG